MTLHNKYVVSKIYKIVGYAKIKLPSDNSIDSTDSYYDRKETYRAVTIALNKIITCCLHENKIITSLNLSEDPVFDNIVIRYDTEELENE